jgi:hypothetical protein
MDPISSELLKYGMAGIVIIGLIFDRREMLTQHAEREKIWKGVLDALMSKEDAIQAGNVALLKENFALNAQLSAELRRLADMMAAHIGKGGA